MSGAAQVPFYERPDARFRDTERVDGHRFGLWRGDSCESCRICGNVRPKHGKLGPCPGPMMLSDLPHVATPPPPEQPDLFA